MTEAVNTSGMSSLSQLLNDIDMGPCDSIQFAYAKLQLAQSMLCKNKAESKLKEIEEKQAEQQKVAKMISDARKLQNQAETSKKCTTMPAEMVQYFKDHDLAYDEDGNDNNHSKDQWAYNIQSLTNYQESLSNGTQTDMVLLQDFISQYNSYLQGASSQVSQAGQTLTALARGQ